MIVDIPQTASASLSEGIELLMDLARQGEIDPWDVQVIDVIDRYLSKLTPAAEATSENQFTELSQSGQAFLYAAMLVLLKSDSLTTLETDSSETQLEGEVEFIEGDDNNLIYLRPQNLERQLRRRAVAKVPQKRRVTLPELIEQLKLMADVIADHKTRPRRRRNKMKSKEAAQAIAELAHQENLTEVAERLEQLLSQSEFSSNQEWLELEELLQIWCEVMPAAPDHHNQTEALEHSDMQRSQRVGVFWGLLLLSAQSKVELVQEEFYQEIKVRTLPTASPSSVKVQA
ncbi:MAG: segregation/condensation protein A [Microcoleaceae cyanobacterium]